MIGTAQEGIIMKNRIPEITVIVFFALILGALLWSCFTPQADRKEIERNYIQDRIFTINPEPGIKCFILPGVTPTDPRSMSCLAVPK